MYFKCLSTRGFAIRVLAGLLSDLSAFSQKVLPPLNGGLYREQYRNGLTLGIDIVLELP